MKRILIIEDNKAHRRLLKDILRVLECAIEEASNTTEAEMILKEQDFDLIILDHGLPTQRGGDWYYEYLQKRDKTRNIPVLFVTVFGMNPEVKKLARQEKVMVLPKPLEATDLVSAARKLLSK